jgi:hypothetical protein
VANPVQLTGLIMTRPTSKADRAAFPPAEEGTGFLFWGWIVVTALNLAMVTIALAMFAP